MKKIRWNSPVVLGFAIVSLIVLVVNRFTGGKANLLLFSVYRSSYTNPLFYLRLFGHVLGHISVEHYMNNMLILLLVGPLLEEKYGSKKFLFIIMAVALATSVAHLIVGGNAILLGASGVVFACILLASVTGTSEDEIPVTLILVALLYLGQQVYDGLFTKDNISQLSHIVGGAVGAGLGLFLRRNNSQ